MTKNAKTWQVIAFNHVEPSPLIDQELNCNVCQLDNMFPLISDLTFIFQKVTMESTPGRVDPGPT